MNIVAAIQMKNTLEMTESVRKTDQDENLVTEFSDN
jgi:hypothetical protein